ncbi:MAG: substrate-binding domain-containing protein [Deltaproteobacteria bacterium]|nr:substrate-binding domain-containing protein [Deltaproteobacteria bacterium]
MTSDHPRRLVASTFVACLAFAASACEKTTPVPAGDAGSASATTGGGDAKPKVAFLLATLQEERYQKDKRFFEAKATALGLSPFVLSADNDNAKQLSQLEDALSRGAKVIVVQPTDSVAAASYVQKAHAKGAKVVAYDRTIKSPDLDVYLSHDAFKIGVIMAEEAVKATGGKGNYLILDGQSGHSVVAEIDRGYMSVLKPLVDKGDVKIVLQKNHEAWSPDQALKTTEDAIAKTKGDLQAVLANNSGMARGAVQAIQAANLGGKKIFIAGSDTDAANVNYLCEGKQTIEVLKDIQPLAEKAAELASTFATGKALEGASGTPPMIALPVELVTKENAKARIVDTGFHPAKAVPACK